MARHQGSIINSVILTFLLCECVHLYSYDDTKRLKQTLFDNSGYRTDMKPTHNQTQSIKVNVSHTLKAVTEVNVPDGYAVVVLELEMKWKDEYLVWNDTEFNGIESINLQKDIFWTPAVTVIDETKDNDVNVLDEKYTPEWVSKDGIVSLYQTVIVKAKCASVVSFYPFDYHDCFVTLMSSKYTIQDVKLDSGPNVQDLETIEIHKQWELNNVSLCSKTYLKGELSFDAIIVSMTVKRRFTFSTYEQFLPLTTLIILDMLTPFVPPDSGERVTLCITIVLAMIVASDSVTDELPKNTAELSLITVYNVIYNFLSTLTVAWSVLIVCLFKRRDKVPVRLIKILRVNIKSNNIHVTTDPNQCQDKETSVGSIETRQADENVCDITWQDITKKMDKVYFYCFMGIYIGLACASLFIFFIIIPQ